jgi:hypothetical protein
MSEPGKAPAPKPDDHDVIYALRTAHQSQTQLNVMADQKANILVGAIIVVLSLLFTRLPGLDLDDRSQLLLVSIFVLLEVVALLFGIMVIRPRTRYLKHSLKIEDMPNPLFFGFFTQYSEQEYLDHMTNLVKDNPSSRELLLRDLYQVGQVLRRKFQLLKFAYNFAAAGILYAVIAVASRLAAG